MLVPFALTRYRDAFGRLSGRDWFVAAAGGIALAVHFASWFESLKWTSVAASVTIVQVQVFFVAAGAAVLLSEHITRRVFIGMTVALCGIVVMFVGDTLTGATASSRAPLYGNTLALVGAICMAGYVLAGRSLRQHIPLIPYVLLVYSVCIVVLFVILTVGRVPLINFPPHEWLLFLGMAVGPGLFGHTVLNWALAHVESSVISVSLLAEPIVSSLLALLLLGEVPTVITLLGGAIVLLGIAVTSRP